MQLSISPEKVKQHYISNVALDRLDNLFALRYYAARLSASEKESTKHNDSLSPYRLRVAHYTRPACRMCCQHPTRHTGAGCNSWRGPQRPSRAAGRDTSG